MSKEWGTYPRPFPIPWQWKDGGAERRPDASKVPPSRFQKREGSIYATQGSRDAHTGRGKDRDQSFHEKLKQKVCTAPGANALVLFELRVDDDARVGYEFDQ